jgi:hypothetical protein
MSPSGVTPPPPAPPVPGVPQPSTPPAVSGPLSVAFTPAQTEVAVGSPVQASIQVNNVSDLAAVQLALKFDPKVLHISNLISGDLIKRNGPELIPSRNVLNDSGDAAVGISRDPASGGITGSGAVLTIVFQAVAKGTTTVTLPQFTMTGSAGQSIAATAPMLTITVK